MTHPVIGLITLVSVFTLLICAWWIYEYGEDAVHWIREWRTLRYAHDIKSVRRYVAKQTRATIKRLKKAEDKNNREYIVKVIDQIKESEHSIISNKQIMEWFAQRGFSVEPYVDNADPSKNFWKITVDLTAKELSDIIVK